jgi:carbonic anhydrase
MNPTANRSVHLPLALALGVATAALTTGCRTTAPATGRVETRESQAAMTPAAALDRLKAGNDRFRTGQAVTRDSGAQRQATVAGQFPFAFVLGCIDSRCAPETVFDQGIGDLFTARVAGNVVNEDILGSMEFGCRVAGARVIVVLGHSKCGAVQGAVNHVELGNLTALLRRIQPSVAEAGAAGAAPRIDAVTEANVRRMVAQIPEQSPVLAELQRAGKLRILGALYSLETGSVRFLE